MQSMKKFSIITVCLNAEKAIGDTIRSVLEQSCTDVEYIVKDGGSKDETVGIAKSFMPAFEKRVFRTGLFQSRIGEFTMQ